MLGTPSSITNNFMTLNIFKLQREFNELKTERDALLAKVRQGLRQDHGFSRNLKRKIGIRAIYSHEPRAGVASGGLACSGYGSTVMVTAACGLAAAAEVLNLIAAQQTISSNQPLNP